MTKSMLSLLEIAVLCVGSLYAHVHHWPANETLPLGKFDAKPSAAAILETGQPLELLENDGEWYARVQKNAPDIWDTVIELRLAAAARS